MVQYSSSRIYCRAFNCANLQKKVLPSKWIMHEMFQVTASLVKWERGWQDNSWPSSEKCVLSFSAYCPQDNVEEALLLLLISESMVSQKWVCNTNSTKEYLAFPCQVFWLVLFTESSLNKQKQGFGCWTGNAIYSFVSDTTLIKWNVSEGVWELLRRGSDCIHHSCMQVLTLRYIVRRLTFPFRTSVWIYGSRVRGREPYIKAGMVVVPAVWRLQDTISCLHSLVCRDNFLAVSVLRDIWQFPMLMIQGVFSHAETSIMNYSRRIRFLLLIT